MTGDGRVLTGALAAALLVCTPGCLEWEPPQDASAHEAEVPALHTITPSSLPPVDSFDPRDGRERCLIACRRYEECYGPQLSSSTCFNACMGEAWIVDSRDLACFIWSGCSELWLCH